MRRQIILTACGLGFAALAATPLAAQQTPHPLSITPSAKPSAARPAISPTTPGGTETAATTAAAPSIDQVNAYLNGLTQLTGNFTQIGPDGARTEGKLYMRRPGKLRFDYNPPSPLEIVADGKSVILRDRRLATQDLYPLGQTPLKFLLADHLDLRRDVVLKSAKLEGDAFIVVIEDRSTFGGTSRVALYFDSKVTSLRRWVVTDPQGYDTTVMLSNLDTSRRPDDKEFVIDYQRIL
ncbi:MAG: outer membrane lipoprotein carrier protein LolA [Hyphomicrobiales bacterium]|nr:outer membrane lipoprotein carrier protein LolA [Hyphomicrobiales bacterium]MBV9433353.1 outer membrane lipoprotein carrier protein LolA [Hyphomicrobiales bacterium]MBW0002726.1 outer membrane lipoprotein carrier protein LolA [Hyphomicrobiales bacterium]